MSPSKICLFFQIIPLWSICPHQKYVFCSPNCSTVIHMSPSKICHIFFKLVGKFQSTENSLENMEIGGCQIFQLKDTFQYFFPQNLINCLDNSTTKVRFSFVRLGQDHLSTYLRLMPNCPRNYPYKNYDNRITVLYFFKRIR